MINNQKIEKVSFNDAELAKEYYGCQFENCDFSKLFIADVSFEECQFTNCDFSMTKFANLMRDSKFIECRMIGADFSEITRFASTFSFSKCNLSYAAFAHARVKNTIFDDCDLKDANFDDTDLTASVFDKCDLTRAVFNNSNLERVDFSTALNFSVNPNFNKLKNARFSKYDLQGLLAHLNIKIV